MTQGLGKVVLQSLGKQLPFLLFSFIFSWPKVEWDDPVSPTFTVSIRNIELTLTLMWNRLIIEASHWKNLWIPAEAASAAVEYEGLAEAGWKGSKEESDIYVPVSTSKGYHEGIGYIFKEQGKFKTHVFGNITLKDIRKIFFNYCGRNLSTNTDRFGFFSNKVLCILRVLVLL